jgi:hypothetical protein
VFVAVCNEIMAYLFCSLDPSTPTPFFLKHIKTHVFEFEENARMTQKLQNAEGSAYQLAC